MSILLAQSNSFMDRTKKFAFHLPHTISLQARITALMLYLHGRDEGDSIYVSVNRLTEFTGLSRSAQFRALKELLALGYLCEDGWHTHKSGIKTRRRRFDRERIDADREAELAAKHSPTDGTEENPHSPTCDFDSPTHGTVPSPTYGTQTDRSNREKEPIDFPAPAALPAWGEFQRVRQQPLFTAPEPPTPEKPKRQSKAAANAALNVPALVETWNRICGPTMGTVQFVSDVRRKALLARMMEFFENDPAKWEAYCRKMSMSRYLTGQVNDFRATFDWSVAPRNVPKVLENNYNRAPEECGEPRPSKAPYAGYNPHLRPGDPDWRPSPGTI